MTRLLLVVVCCLAAPTAFAEPPTTGPETEKRFPPLKVPEGFRATLFACDPLIEYPSSIALGPRANTLFVAVDYMTGLGTTDIIQRDEIRLVEDTDGDGYADRGPVWADGFNSIQGMTYHDGTVFVMHAPYLTALRDTDGDGVADERKNLFRGFGLGPEDDKVRLHNANGIVAGHDGWLYLALGDRGCDVVRPEGDLLILNGGGILRCRPDGRDLHVFSTGLRNIYDVALDEDLNVFTRDNENDGGNYKIRVIQSFFGADHGYPYLYDERPDEALAPLADLGLGSSAGGVYYKETQFPSEYRGLYFCEWGRAVMRYSPESPGKPFSPLKEIEFASGAENDPYGFKPTDLIVDHDGSLLIADWADGQRPKRGRARIYRVEYVGRTPTSDQKGTTVKLQGRAGVPILQDALRDLVGWIERLNSDSYYERLEAQLAIEKLGRDDPQNVVETLRNSRNLNERATMHCVWILTHLLGAQARDELFKLAHAGDFFAGDSVMPRLRTQAIRALADLHDPILAEHQLDAEAGDAAIAKRFANLVHRRHPGTTLEVVAALGRMKWAQAPQWMSEHLTWMEPNLAHAAQQTLRRCGDWLAVLRLLDEPAQTSPRAAISGRKRGDETPLKLPLEVPLRTVALRALADQADKTIVEGLEVRIRLANDPARRREYADLLSRVHRKPSARWVYWGFRPAPRPANTVAWTMTEFIELTLDRLLADTDLDLRRFVLQRMQRERIPTRLETLAAWLRNETDGARVAAILESLREHPVDGRQDLLRQAVVDARKPLEARLAAFELWQTDEARTEKVVELARTLGDDPVLARLLSEFGRRTVKDSVESRDNVVALLAFKSDSRDASVRAAAVESIGRLRLDQAKSAIEPRLRDADPRVRRAAAFAAGQFELQSVIPSLLELAGDANADVRAACFDALRQLREPRVGPLAAAAVRDPVMQLSALRCLADFGGSEHAAMVLEVATRNSSVEVVSLAARMLARCVMESGLNTDRREEFQHAMLDLQGASGLLIRWQISEPLTPENATKWAASALAAANVATWTELFAEGPDGRMRLDKTAGGSRFALAEFHVDEASSAQFFLSSDGPLKVWLNGVPVFDRNATRRFQPESDRFDATLAAGTNRLVVQLDQPANAAIEFHARFRRKSSKAEHERLVEAALARPGNVERGRKLFLDVNRSQCLKCHRLGEQGEKVGPELTGIGSRFSRMHIIESLLEPSRTLAAGFQSQTVVMLDGRVLTGLKIAETAESLTLVDNQGKKYELAKADIEESKLHTLSIMPEGLEKRLTVDEFVDLIGFLTSEKQTQVR